MQYLNKLNKLKVVKSFPHSDYGIKTTKAINSHNT